ncbi:nuclear transport factor 2 family protein [Euryhalocaulis caribicus]|uniref:nuclear transport factor 2 family protein n=1 Tax=Euryhalocaulis caribicus TaxID=1161401 RepID=UPI0003A9923B|nr:nuclear transport factor 2 family protein [Euryhalocaulis caribicus]
MHDIDPAATALLDAWKAMDEDGYLAAFADTFRTIDPYGETTTPDGVKEHIQIIRQNWKDLDYVVDDAFSADDRAVIAYTISMTGTAGGWEGKRVSLPCMAMVRTEGGKIAEWREQFDTGVLVRARKKAA